MGSRIVVLLLIVGTLVVPGTTLVVAHSAPGAAPGVTAAAAPALAHVPATEPAAAPAPATNPAGAMAASALAATRSLGLSPIVEYPPRASATPTELAQAAASGTVTPLYTGIPAPVGLADYGLARASNGTVVGSVVRTTSVRASVDFNATGVAANDLFLSSPDAFGVQLNAVLTNVTIQGVGTYAYWTQNVVSYEPSTGTMILVTNVWNFSARGASITNGTIYSHGPYGTNLSAELGYYYAEQFVAVPVLYPYNLTLYLNSTVVGGRNAVDFTVLVQNRTTTLSFPYDDVVFNSLRAGHAGVGQPAEYAANGKTYNAVGLTNDFEVIFGGPGGGSQADLFDADATLGLAYLAGASYVAVPSAYNYGGETGETVTGAYVGWSDAPGGPAGLPTYATMSTGPTILSGLWNASGPEGTYPLTVDVSPSNAFTFVTPENFSRAFTVEESSYAPSVTTDVFYLAPGNYSLLTELSDFTPVTTTVSLRGPLTVDLALAANASEGIYTPLWAWSNAQLAALSTAGDGTPGNPYLIENTQAAPIGPKFGLYNDYTFPVFPGVFLLGTNASVEFDQPASLATSTSTFQPPGGTLPATNDLPYWFEGVRHVALVNGTNVSGWFGNYTWYPTVFNTFSVVFYASSDNLVAGNHFRAEQGLLLYSGGTFSGATNVGGGNNTVWGNNFSELKNPNSTHGLFPSVADLGVELAESGDLVYDNAFLTATTAWLLPLNLDSGAAENYSVTWNITPQPAANVHYAAGFPLVPLTGSIVGTAEQGGNYWWDYGVAYNPYNGANDPYGTLPYDENAPTLASILYGTQYYDASYIYNGGDLDPLLTYALYSGGFSVSTGHGPSTPSVEILVGRYDATYPLDPYPLVGDASIAADGGTLTLQLPNGTYAWDAVESGGYVVSPDEGEFYVYAGNFSTIHLNVSQAQYFAFFVEEGLPAGTNWSLTFNGTPTTVSASAKEFLVPNGTFAYSVRSVPGTPGYAPSPAFGNVTIAGGSATVTIDFGRAERVTFRAVGLPDGASWSVATPEASGSTTVPSIGPSTIVLAEAEGTLTFSVTAPAGYGVAYVAGLRVLNYSTADILGAATIVVHFGPLEDLYFNVTGAVPGNWSVTISSGYRIGGSPVTQTRWSTGPSIEFPQIVKGSWRFVVLGPLGATPHPARGTVALPARTFTRSLRFTA